MTAIWTSTGHQKAVEILLTLLARGDHTDPMQRIQVETLMHLPRLMRKHEEELRGPFEEMWEEASSSAQPRGPIGIQ